MKKVALFLLTIIVLGMVGFLIYRNYPSTESGQKKEPASAETQTPEEGKIMQFTTSPK